MLWKKLVTRCAQLSIHQQCDASDHPFVSASSHISLNRAPSSRQASRVSHLLDESSNVVGILLGKTLIVCDTPLYDAINLFQEHTTHFATVCEDNEAAPVEAAWRDKR